jgi:oxysterol-binding protein-related protein 8
MFVTLLSDEFHLLTSNSNGTTPQQIAEQILAITPILPGQKSNEKNPIPPQRQAQPAQANHTLPAPAAAPQPQAQAPQDDLIDFGQHDGATATLQQPLIPADLKAAQTQNNGQQQKDLEDTLRSTSTSPPPEKGGLIDFHDDLKSNLPGEQHTLKRQDTDTQSLDEFVDAEG